MCIRDRIKLVLNKTCFGRFDAGWLELLDEVAVASEGKQEGLRRNHYQGSKDGHAGNFIASKVDLNFTILFHSLDALLRFSRRSR